MPRPDWLLVTSEGGRSHGTVLAKVVMTPSSRSTPMLWFPVRVPSHIFRNTYTCTNQR